MPVNAVHRRQFVLGPERVRPTPQWVHRPGPNGLILSHCPMLAVRALGHGWWCLGRAIETAEDDTGPGERLADAGVAATFSWAGRWLLLSETGVFSDPWALLGCLYGQDARGRLWMSSSLPLLTAALGGAEIVDPRRLTHERGLSWYPAPLTQRAGIMRLLPSQHLHLNGRVAPRPLLPALAPGRAAEAVETWVERYLTQVLHRLAQTRGPLWLGLTAGYDSRLLLAIAAKAEVPIRPYTRLTARMSVADRVLPPSLTDAVGLSHETIVDRDPSEDRRSALADHAGDGVAEGDALPFLKGTRDRLIGVNIGGHGLALASGFANWRQLPGEMPSPEAAAELILDVMGEPRTSPARAGLIAWARWAAETPMPHLDWRDRLFIEQRQAAWLAAKEQVFDMQRVERVPLFNCAALHAQLLSLPEDARLGSKLQARLISRVAPALDAMPYNPSDRYFLLTHPRRVFARAANRLSRRFGDVRINRG